ncbi:MAG: DUF3011 domain-containing protein [Lysobacteraceae bacterium]
MAADRLLLCLAAAGLLAMAGTARAQSTITCESSGGQYRSCPVNTANGVTLSRQLSREGCWQGDTWGYDRNRIWVNRGCRAEFRVGGSRDSNNNGAKIAGAVILGVIAAAVIAKHNDDDRNDRYDNDYGYGGSYNDRYTREFTCASKAGRMSWCGQRVNRRQHVEIKRQLSDSPCVYGRSWGMERGDVWVDNGCRAVFVAY